MSSSDPALQLATPRLNLRPLSASDFEIFYATLIADPAVMRFYHSYRDLQDPAARRARAQRDFFEHFDEGARRHGYIAWGLWSGAALHPGPAQFVGWCAITTPALKDAAFGPEVQYMLAARWQGKGLASEAARAVVADAFARHSLPTLHAVADAPNQASRRVIERLGFTFRGQVEVYGSTDMALYTMGRAAWEQRLATVAQTERLRVRRFTLADAPFTFELVNDPAWLRFIGDRGVRSLDDARNYIEQGPLQSYGRLGYGLYLVEAKDTREPLGMCGLLKRDYLEHADIGFAFLPQHTGKGYAREAAAAVLDHGRQLGMQRIFAIVNPENETSIRLLLKLGFRLEGTVRPPGEDREINLFATSDKSGA